MYIMCKFGKDVFYTAIIISTVPRCVLDRVQTACHKEVSFIGQTTRFLLSPSIG